MNHDVLRDSFTSTSMQVYAILLEEYKNEEQAKRVTLKLAEEALSKFSVSGSTAELRDRLKTLVNAMNKKYAELVKKDGIPEGILKGLQEDIYTMTDAVDVLERMCRK